MLLRQAMEDIEMLKAVIDEADGEISPEIEQRLDAAQGTVEAKVNSLRTLISEIDLEADGIEKEIARLQKRAASRRSTIKAIKAWLLNMMQAHGLRKIKTESTTVTICRNGRPSIEWTRDLWQLPDELAKTSRTLDGDAAYHLWKTHDALPDGFTVREGTHLRIT